MMKSVLSIALILLHNQVDSFYLPGVAPHSYQEGDSVPLHVNSLTPNYVRNDYSESVLPYEYYNKDFGFCKPEGGPQLQSESLGGILFGDRIYNSPFEIKMLKPKSCELVCKNSFSDDGLEFLKDRIKERYAHNWLIDDLPVLYDTTDNSKFDSELISLGFPLGSRRTPSGAQLLNNHFDITIHYHPTKSGVYRVVKAQVSPRSILHPDDEEVSCSPESAPLQLIEGTTKHATYTYSVTWKESDISWATRWDSYLKVNNSSVHWFSLINSSVIVLFLSGMIAMIIFRTLYKDITRYNQIDAQEDIQEEYGWKLIHGDVFRTPVYHGLLCAFVGSGCQIFGMATVTLLFAVLGFLSPSNRGSLVTALVTTFMLFGSVSGFVSARLYKMLGGDNWKSNMLMTAFLFPGCIFTIFLILNFFLLGAGSSAAVPAGTIFGVIAFWFLISAPLSFVGAYFGFKKPRIIQPVKTNQIPRQIPDQPFYLKFLPTILIGGILPFGAIFIELYLIMNSLWFHRLYYVFGFLFIVFIVLSITCAEVTILLSYFHLCSENYNWWWRSFLTSGTTGFYAFLYSVIFFLSRLKSISGVSAVIYFGWALVTSAFIFILTGTIGFLSCLFFVRKIYGSIKID